jgi:hypothetical protein
MSWISVWRAGQQAWEYAATGMQYAIAGTAVDR